MLCAARALSACCLSACALQAHAASPQPDDAQPQQLDTLALEQLSSFSTRKRIFQRLMASRIPFRLSTRRLRGIAAIWICMLLTAQGWAQAKPSEYDVKAAYLFDFGKFMRVAGKSQPRHSSFDICILGRDPLGRAMDEIAANESIGDRPVRVSRINNAGRGRECDILFISPYEGDAIRSDLAALAGADVLTVSDAPDFLERGGMIQFILAGDHVRFEVNLDAVDRTHLVLSSELLRVAFAVKGMPPGGMR